MLTKAERNTRVMVNTPTRVLFFLDRTIFLESVCRGVGKSWHKKGERDKSRNQLEPLRQPWSSEDIPCPWNSSPDFLEPLQDCVAPCSFHCPLPQIARASALDRESVNRAHHTDD